MKCRLKSDHKKVVEVTPKDDSKLGRPWWHVRFTDARLHGYMFDVPESFLEEAGWEPVPEKEPKSIEDELDAMAGESPDTGIYAVCRRAAAEIRRLNTEHNILLGKYEQVMKANAELGMALVEKLAKDDEAAAKSKPRERKVKIRMPVDGGFLAGGYETTVEATIIE